MSQRKSDETFYCRPEWCRVTLARIGDAVIATDPQGQVTFLNPVAESLTGWTQQEAVGVPLEQVFKIVDHETRMAVESPTVRALRDDVIVGLGHQTLLVAKDGTERSIGPVDDSAAPIRSHQGELAGALLVFRDTTEIRRQERALQSALAYAENIIATLREPFIVLDKDLRVKTANQAFYQRFEVSSSDTEGRFLCDLGSGQWNSPGLRTLLEQVLSSGHPIHDFELEHDFPAIGKKIMLLNARRFDSVDHQPELILVAIEDVTRHRRAEVAMQTSEVRYRRLFETAKDGILILDAETGRILDANPFMTELLDYSRGELLGKELWMIGLFNDKAENEAAFRQLQQQGYIRYDHLPLKSKDDRRAEVEFVSNVYYVDHRHVAQCNIRDISERSRLERQMKEQGAALADLHRRKDEFLAMLSHELRNPLAPILSAVQLLGREPAGSTHQQQALAIIERQVKQLAHLVDDLLEVSRISTGRIHLDRERLDMRFIVQRGLETAQPLIDQRRHVLSLHLPLSPIWINGDSARLEQVVVNLLSNAAKYTDDAGRIWLSLEQDGNEALLHIRDSGVGIAPELLPRIFDLFTQADRSLARSQGGLGIGLNLVERLVNMHTGKVLATSTLGEGSEFIVRLPVASTAGPLPLPNENRTGPTGPSLRLLVVDDNADTVQALALLLQASGHKVRTAHDGPSTLQAALDYRPDAVLLDIGLPGLDGFEVAKRLRQQPPFQNVVLVAMTGYGQEADRRRSQAAGFDHHLVKPVSFRSVEQILATVSGQKPQTASLHARAGDSSSGVA